MVAACAGKLPVLAASQQHQVLLSPKISLNLLHVLASLWLQDNCQEPE